MGCLPDVTYYDSEEMPASKKKKFETWYASQEGVVFHLKQHLVAFWKSDVALLKAGCEKFVTEFRVIAEWCGFSAFLML